jgi:ubiquinone/menaquinone biosynthesis C-methylase UbiE
VHDWRSYDDIAEAYERIEAPKLAVVSHDLISLASPPSGGRALDVGTGTGVTASAAAAAMDAGSLTVGADPSMGMLLAGASVRPGPRVVAEAIDLPFREGTFDLVTATFVLQHFASYRTALFDMIRVLKAGGRLAVSTWADGRDELTSTWESLVEDVVPREVLVSAKEQAAPWRDRFAHRDAVEEALRGAGLKHVRTEPAQYHFRYTVDEYVESASIRTLGRFARDMLGEEMWRSLVARARDSFTARFADPLNDFRDVILGVGTKA